MEKLLKLIILSSLLFVFLKIEYHEEISQKILLISILSPTPCQQDPPKSYQFLGDSSSHPSLVLLGSSFVLPSVLSLSLSKQRKLPARHSCRHSCNWQRIKSFPKRTLCLSSSRSEVIIRACAFLSLIHSLLV